MFKKFRKWFLEKVWPWLKLLPFAILIGLVLAFVYDWFVSGSFKLYIYLTGVLISIPGFYIAYILVRKMKKWEYKDPRDEVAQ